jgi:hypothetical protein
MRHTGNPVGPSRPPLQARPPAHEQRAWLTRSQISRVRADASPSDEANGDVYPRATARPGARPNRSYGDVAFVGSCASLIVLGFSRASRSGPSIGLADRVARWDLVIGLDGGPIVSKNRGTLIAGYMTSIRESSSVVACAPGFRI